MNERTSPTWNDRPFAKGRPKRIMQGHGRQVSEHRFDKMRGDYETFCRATEVLLRFWDPKEITSARDSILNAADVCMGLSGEKIGYDGLYEAMRNNYNVFTLSQSLDIPNFVGWTAVCWVKGAEYADMIASGFFGEEGDPEHFQEQELLKAVFEVYNEDVRVRRTLVGLKLVYQGKDYNGID